MPEQSTLADYYRRLLAWEGQVARQLVHEWPTELVETIKADFYAAIHASGFKSSVCPTVPGSSNQSIGNQVEFFFIQKITQHLQSAKIGGCGGAGYPDRVLELGTLRIPLEVKATSDWNPRDSNRRVLTSSSEKLRARFSGSIHHLLATALYTVLENSAQMNGLRLDFLQPTTPVNIRLEASVNHKILATGSHPHVVF